MERYPETRYMAHPAAHPRPMRDAGVRRFAPALTLALFKRLRAYNRAFAVLMGIWRCAGKQP